MSGKNTAMEALQECSIESIQSKEGMPYTEAKEKYEDIVNQVKQKHSNPTVKNVLDEVRNYLNS